MTGPQQASETEQPAPARQCRCPRCSIPDSPTAQRTGWCGYCGDHCRKKPSHG